MSFLFRSVRSSKKKNKDKENVPSDSKSKGKHEQLDHTMSDVYMGETKSKPSNQLPPHVLNPYSVVTAPKTTKATRSLPGGPIDDRRERKESQSLYNSSYGIRPFNDRFNQHNASVRYENVPRPRNSQNRKIDSLNTSRRAFDDSMNRNRYYERESYMESDDDELSDARQMIMEHEQELRRIRQRCKALREENRYLRKELKDSTCEAEYYKQNFDRERRAVERANRNLQLVSKLKKELQLANARINELEEQIHAEQSGADSSLLTCNYGVYKHPISGGAGESLCDNVNDAQEMVSSNTPSVSMFQPDRDDYDGVDQIRVFRREDSDNDDLEESQRNSPIEKPRTAISPDGDIDYGFNRRTSPVLTIHHPSTPGSGKLFRSLSDTNIHTLSHAEEEETQREASTLDRDPRRMLRTPHKSHVSSDTSDDDQLVGDWKRRVKVFGDFEKLKYHPGRPQVQSRTYKKFGKNERSAMQQFEFLADMSSDFSGMLSSPDAGLGLQTYR